MQRSVSNAHECMCVCDREREREREYACARFCVCSCVRVCDVCMYPNTVLVKRNALRRVCAVECGCVCFFPVSFIYVYIYTHRSQRGAVVQDEVTDLNHTLVYIYTHKRNHTHMYTRTRTHTCVYKHAYIYIYLY